jgi:hypothetical protein
MFNGQELGESVLSRQDCDPFQSAWCAAVDSPAADLDAGHYDVQIDHAALCSNDTSGGNGFIRIWGQWR